MDIDELIEAMEEGEVECPCCGDIIELDGICSEGTPSPLITAGMI